jgi:hypothetical protein
MTPRRFEMDYEGRRLQFDLLVWVGDLSSPDGRELYRPSLLTFRDVAYLIVESPSADSVPLTAETIRIDAGEGRPARSSSEIPTAPANTSVTWMYLGEPNTFLIFAAGEASLEWTGLAETRAPAL